MSKIKDSELAKMSVLERFQLRRQCAENRDIESLLIIAKYRLINGAPATSINTLPELCYYFGRLRRHAELQKFLEGKDYLSMSILPKSCFELAQNLFRIGFKFPYLNELEISYLEEKYCDPSSFQLFDIIMFDCDRLPRTIKKFDKESLNKVNDNFTRDFLIQLYDCFSENEELDIDHDQIYAYSRSINMIYYQKYELIGLGEYYIDQPILFKEFRNLIQEQYGAECRDYFVKRLQLPPRYTLDHSYNYDSEPLNAKNIENIATEYFKDTSKMEDVKAIVALFWLKKVNSEQIILI